ncbi:MAG: NDP-sugar synthase [Acidobacteriota bacterium]|nr:NDP-sugar synthase [Acidobacteriota bacterium]
MVLAAGLGTRLWPLTRSLPKPLLPVAGTPLLSRTLAEFQEAGCEAVALNLFHQGEKISAHFGSHFDDMELVYSWEEELQGTLGALAPLEGFFAPADVLVVINGDSLSRWPIERLVERHQRGSAQATLLLTSRADPKAFGGGVGVDAAGRIVSFSPEREHGVVEQRLVFAGAHAFAPSLVAGRDRQPEDFITDLYEPLLEAGGVIQSLETSRPWYDLGTPARYLEGVCDWIRRRGGGRVGGRTWVSPEAKVSEGASVRRAVIESGVVIETQAEVERAVVLPGARVGRGAVVRESILGFSVRLGAGTSVERRMVTVARADRPLGPLDSVVGGLVYSPLDV